MGHVEKIWLTLIGLTLAGAWLAETGEAGWALTLLVAGLILVKAGLVIDHYMEMRLANRRIRAVLFGFVSAIALMVVISHGWGEVIRRLTTLG